MNTEIPVVGRELELRDILDLLFQFTSVQQRMIQWDATVARQAQSPPSLQSLARDAVVLRLCWCGQHHHTDQACQHSSNNYRNRLVHYRSQMGSEMLLTT